MQFTLSENVQPRADDEAGSDSPGNPSNDDGAVPPGSCDEAPSPTSDLTATPVPEVQAELGQASVLALQPKPGKDISPASLRSPDDLQATHRKKGQQDYDGYVSNLTETCDPDNPFQLILKVQSESNNTEDTTMLKQAMPGLKARTDVHTLYNDAGFCGPSVDKLLRDLEIEQVPTALKGRVPAPGRTTLADCDIQLNAVGGIPAVSAGTCRPLASTIVRIATVAVNIRKRRGLS